jgi:hypothetical protein
MNGCRISKVEQSIFFTCLTTFCSVLRVPVAKTMETEAGITGEITADVMGLPWPAAFSMPYGSFSGAQSGGETRIADNSIVIRWLSSKGACDMMRSPYLVTLHAMY